MKEYLLYFWLFVHNVVFKPQDPDMEEKRKNELAKIKREKKKFKGRIQEAIQKKKGKMLMKRANRKKVPSQTAPGSS